MHRNLPAAPAPFLNTIAPSREDVVVWVEGLFTWSWLADLWAQEGVPFVLGHALSMKAIHGGKAHHDPSDAQNIAVRLRGGMLPQADVYPAAMRAERLAHVHHPTSPYHLPAIGKTLADPANRAGGAERLADPAVHQRIDVDLARSNDDAERLREVELPRLQTAQHHDANTRYLLPTVPGIGTILRLVGLYEIHASNRFPPVQDVVSSCRLGNGAQASAGKRLGPAGTKIAKGPLTGAFSDAAVLVLRDHPPAQQYLARWESNQDHGTALPVLAHKVARAVYDMRKRPVAFDQAQGFHHAWRGAEEPGASLDTEGMNLPDALDTAASRASWQAQARLGRDPLSPAR